MCVVLLLFTVRWNLNDEQKHQRLNFMENLATGLVFIIVVVNVFITAFGVHRTNYSNWPRTHTQAHLCMCVCIIFTVFHCSPLSFQTGIFSPALLCSLLLKTFMSSACFCSTPLLTGPSQSPTWPTNTVTSPGSQRNFHQKTTRTKYTAVHLPENHCPAWLQAPRENSEQERNSRSDKEVWYVNNTTFVLNGQTGKWRQQQSGPCDLMLSVSYDAVRQWPDALARHGCTVSHTHLNTL